METGMEEGEVRAGEAGSGDGLRGEATTEGGLGVKGVGRLETKERAEEEKEEATVRVEKHFLALQFLFHRG
jgi:hypothetical protein